jgi:hypothetical protein
MRRVGATELRGRQILRHSPERLQNSRYISSSAVILDYADAKVEIHAFSDQWTFPLITKILIWTKISSHLERASQN